MKLIKKFIIILTILFSFFIDITVANPDMAISDEELKSLNLSPEEEKEFQQLIETINNLPPEEKEFLNELGKEIEKKMESEGLDPSNPEDIFSWLEKQQEPESNKNESIKETNILDEKNIEEKNIEEKNKHANIDNIKNILESIIKHMASFRQKATINELLSNSIERYNQEINQLIYIFNIFLANKELLNYLFDPEFKNLYENIQNLYTTLINNEPKIEIENYYKIKGDLENPYEVLGIPLNADIKQIEQAYNNLKNEYDQELITEKLKKEGLDEKEINKKIKQAKLSFSFIQNAYNSLKDPKEKAIIDKNLKDLRLTEEKLNKANNQFLSTIKDTLVNSLFSMLTDSKKLLEKYKPTELKKAKEYEAQQKKLLEESKKLTKVTPSPSQKSEYGYKKDENEEFYKHLARQQKEQKYFPFQPYTPPSELNPKEQSVKEEHKNKTESLEKQDKKEIPKKEIKKEEQPTNKSNKENKSAKKEETKKNEEKKEEKPNIKDIEDLVSFKNLLARANENKNINLDQISKNLENYLITGIVRLKEDKSNQTEYNNQKEIIKNINNFIETNKIKDIWQLANKINPKDKKIKDNLTASEIKEIIKYKDLVNSWYNKIYRLLAQDKLNNTKVNSTKHVFHGLSIPENQIKDIEKDIKISKNIIDLNSKDLEFTNLAVYRKYLKDIKNTMDNLEKSIK